MLHDPNVDPRTVADSIRPLWPAFAGVMQVTSEFGKKAVELIIASAIGGALASAGAYALVITELRAQVVNNRERMVLLERASRENSVNVTQNSYELLRQAGNDKLIAQRLTQIENHTASIDAKLEKIYDGQFDGRYPYRGQLDTYKSRGERLK